MSIRDKYSEPRDEGLLSYQRNLITVLILGVCFLAGCCIGLEIRLHIDGLEMRFWDGKDIRRSVDSKHDVMARKNTILEDDGKRETH